MHEFLFASARDAEAQALVSDCLEQIGSVPAAANLGFAYATEPLGDALPAILARLTAHAPGVQWVGAVGAGICVSGREIYDSPALALLIGAFPEDGFRILDAVREGVDPLPVELSDWAGEQGYCFALLHGDPSDSAVPEVLSRLLHGSRHYFINGGLTSSTETPAQLANASLTGGLSGVLFNDQVQVLTDHTQGCTPVGSVHEITRAQQNFAIALDHRPALEVMKEDIGELYARDLTKIGGHIFAALPIRGSDTGDYLVRNLIGIDPQRGVVAVGEVLDDKSQLMFCRRDGDTAREDLERMLERLHRRIDGAPVRGAVYISCLGRGRHQFGANSEELQAIRQALGDFPLVGFFANGEIYNGRLYGYTGVLTLFL